MPDRLELADVLSEFARTMVTDFPIQGILDHLVGRIVDVLPITAAGVTLIAAGSKPRFVAASDDAALRFERLQTELDEGPCLTAFATAEAVAVPDLRTDTRFPKFASSAVRAGLLAVFAFPLRHGTAQVGALDLYRQAPGGLDPESMRAAQTLADVAAAYLLNAQARSELQELSDRSVERSLHDDLTGLANRTLLLERLEQALRRGRRSESNAGVLFVDLDQFKRVNDVHGHRVGDELLVAVAERLSAYVRPGDTLARVSGDEFVVLCEDLAGAEEADIIAARVAAAISVPFELSVGAVETSASVGVAFAGRANPKDLLHVADLAMYHAKRTGGGSHRVIDLGQASLFEATAAARGEDPRGDTETIAVVYQPIVSTVDGKIVGAEASLAPGQPARGLDWTVTLVSLAQHVGVTPDGVRMVLEQACTDGLPWRDTEVATWLKVPVHQLVSGPMMACIEDVLLSTGTKPELLTLELTSTELVPDRRRAVGVVNDLRSLGVKVALDDFGAGYAPLTYLQWFPVDAVKISSTFLADLDQDPAGRAIVGGIVEMSHALGILVAAAGVETAGVQDAVVELGCDAYQGSYFAPPMPPDDAGRLIRDHG